MIIQKALTPPPDMANADGMMRWLQSVAHAVPRMASYSVSLTPGSVAGSSTAEQEFAVAGLHTDDVVFVNMPGYVSGILVGGARVETVGKVRLLFVNIAVGAQSPPAGVYKIYAIRR